MQVRCSFVQVDARGIDRISAEWYNGITKGRWRDLEIIIRKDPALTGVRVTVECPTMDATVEELVAMVSLVDNTLTGIFEGETHFVPLGDILYFETVDGRVFFYDRERAYETPTKLYQLEERLTGTPFARVSKSVIVNLRRVRSIKREGNSRLVATLTNGERVVVSRQYLPVVKERLGI